jgi:hypothetical protein
MIPKAYIIAWRTEAPWPEDAQVEQDLIISRARSCAKRSTLGSENRGACSRRDAWAAGL